MPTTWFFDGSGMGSDCRTLVLSAVGGSDEAWKAFDDEWRLALAELQIHEWHSTDYFRRRTKPRTVPDVLLDVVVRHTKREFNCISFAVDKGAAETAHRQYPTAVPSASKMLVDLCLSGIGCSVEDRGQPDRVRILFDRGEPFIRHLKADWQDGRKELRRIREEGWPRQVPEIEPARSKDYPGLQVADLLSWSVRSRYEYGDEFVDLKVLTIVFTFMAVLRVGFLDPDALRAGYIKPTALTLKT